MSASSSGNLQKTVGALRARYGEIRRWPGDFDEVMIGTIFSQQTRWEYVARALAELRLRGLCSIPAVRSADLRDIGEAIRCMGYFKKAHAYIGEYAKEFCIKKRCDTCILVNSSG